MLDSAVKLVNAIKAKPLQSRLFERLCDEMGSVRNSLLLHSDVRWLSRGKVLSRLVELRKKVAAFLNDSMLDDNTFVLKLSYLSDIFSKLNSLNLNLQGTGSNDIFIVHDKIRALIKKVTL